MESRFDALAFCDVAYHGQGNKYAIHLQRAEHDVHREFRAIFASTMEFETHAHRADARLNAEILSVGRVQRSKAFGNQRLDRQSQQFCARVSENSFRLRIEFNDSPVSIGDNNAIGANSKSFSANACEESFCNDGPVMFVRSKLPISAPPRRRRRSLNGWHRRSRAVSKTNDISGAP